MTTAVAIDLSKFCDHDTDGRYALRQPWVRNGNRYATNGSILICIPAPGEPDTNDDKRRPNIRDFLPPIDGDWQSWPAVDKCKICNGTGTVIVSDEDDDLCVCNLTTLDLFGGCRISIHYSSLIAALPNAEFLPSQKRYSMLRFRFSGGEGAVMGMKEDV